MLYILDGAVIYDSVNGTLRRPEERLADANQLTVIASKILHHLVQHQGELVTRETLFNDIWERAGIAPSSNTLNQYISLLRKTLAGYIGDKDIIVTVPRAGYYLSKEIGISSKIKLLRKRPLISKLITSALGLMMIIIVCAMFIYISRTEVITPRKIGELQGCPVYDISGVKSKVADTTSFSVAKEVFERNKQTCTDNASFYIYTQESLHLNNPAKILFSHCIEWDSLRDTCQNIYYHTWIH
ncbi:helix-turn-helix domain-containing protein [Enterobacteriaceae bacterium G50]|nr:helix-turn-helix domain-containing protein [Enterobacteriaceae bacterium G50]